MVVAALMGDATVQTVAVNSTYPDWVRALQNRKRAVSPCLPSCPFADTTRITRAVSVGMRSKEVEDGKEYMM